MAGLDYETTAFDHKSQLCDGTFEGDNGQSIMIYKDWVYIRDPRAWHDKCGYTKPTIAELQSGNLIISGMQLNVARSTSQRAVFVSMSTYYGSEQRFMAGIGCYGWSDPIPAMCEAAGVNPDDWDSFNACSEYKKDGKQHPSLMAWDYKNDKMKEFHLSLDPRFEPEWIGTTQTTYDEFIQFLEEVGQDTGDAYTSWLNLLPLRGVVEE